MHIVGTDTGNGVRLIAVHIDQRLEAVLFSTVKQPVNRAFLINLAVVGVEVAQEVIPNHVLRLPLAVEGIRNEFQIFVQRICAVDGFHKLHEQTDNIILEVFIVADGDNVILIRSERSILAIVPFAACIGKPIHIQRVTTKHTANRIGNERTNISAKVSLANRDILILDFRCQLILQAVNVNENTVQFFLIGFQLVEAVITFRLPLGKSFSNGRNFAKQWMVLKI